MKLQQVLSASVVFLMGVTAAMAVDQRVTDLALAPKNPAGTIAFSTASWEPNKFSTTISNEIWTIECNGSSLRPFVGPGANLARFSPDGKWLYFQSNASGRSSIYRSPIDGSETRNLTGDASLGQETFGFTFAARSPQMAFVSASDGVSRVGVMDLDGKNASIVNPGLGYHYMASLSPNANEIVFSHTEDNYRLKRMNYDGTNIVSLAPDLTQSYMGQYTPDGQKLVFLNLNGDLYRVDRDASNLMRLTTGNDYTTFYITSPTGTYPANADEQHGSTDAPRISPDGRQIAYVSKATGLPQVYVMDIDGSNQRRLTDLPLACGRVEWSPTSDELAFVSFAPDGCSQLFLTDLLGGTPRQLTHFTDRSVNFVSWSPLPEPGAVSMLFTGFAPLLVYAIYRLKRATP